MLPVVCPAGSLQSSPEGDSCWCGVEQASISAALSPSSLTSFCLSNYVDCPTWRAEKERVWAGSHRELIDDAAVEAARSGKPTRELPEGVTFHEEAYEVPYA
jgi:hypothetical protein